MKNNWKLLTVLSVCLLFFANVSSVRAKLLVFSNEQAQTASTGEFVIDTQNYETEIELKFGQNIDAAIVFDRTIDTFKINRNINLGGNEIQNFRLESLGVAPTCDTASAGRIYFNTTDSHTYACQNQIWVRLDKTGLETNSTEQTIDYNVLSINTINVLSDTASNRPADQRFIVKTLGDTTVKTQVATNGNDRYYRVYESSTWSDWISMSSVKGKYDGYALDDIDQTDGTVSYILRTRESDGKWLITKSDTTGFAYAQIENNATETTANLAWNNRLTLTYATNFTP